VSQLEIKVKILPHGQGLPLPAYQSTGASGMDLYSANEASISLEPFQRVAVPSGLSMAVPAGYEVQVRPRSGLAFRNGITVLNSPGTIDSDYRGEIKVLLINLGQDIFVIPRGMRIAQMIIAPVIQAQLQPYVELDDTIRGEGGFGSTGIHT
jgi:dUTP pyrophosphatase